MDAPEDDLLPPGWEGHPPSRPLNSVADLLEYARKELQWLRSWRQILGPDAPTERKLALGKDQGNRAALNVFRTLTAIGIDKLPPIKPDDDRDPEWKLAELVEWLSEQQPPPATLDDVARTVQSQQLAAPSRRSESEAEAGRDEGRAGDVSHRAPGQESAEETLAALDARSRAEHAAQLAAADRERQDLHRRDRLYAAWTNIYVPMPTVHDDAGVNFRLWTRNIWHFCEVAEREGAAESFRRTQSDSPAWSDALSLIKAGFERGPSGIADTIAKLEQKGDRAWMKVFNDGNNPLFWFVMNPPEHKSPEAALPTAAFEVENVQLWAGKKHEEFVFARSGDSYFIAGFGERGHVRKLKGFVQIAKLICTPGRPVPMIELAVDAADARLSADAHSRQPAADAKMLSELKDRLGEAIADMNRAKAENDTNEIVVCQQEIESVSAQLKQVTGLGGKSRDLNSRSNKLRPSSYARLKTAYSALRAAVPPMKALAAHFEESICAEGESFIYRPRRPAPNWSFDSSPQ